MCECSIGAVSLMTRIRQDSNTHTVLVLTAEDAFARSTIHNRDAIGGRSDVLVAELSSDVLIDVGDLHLARLRIVWILDAECTTAEAALLRLVVADDDTAEEQLAAEKRKNLGDGVGVLDTGVVDGDTDSVGEGETAVGKELGSALLDVQGRETETTDTCVLVHQHITNRGFDLIVRCFTND